MREEYSCKVDGMTGVGIDRTGFNQPVFIWDITNPDNEGRETFDLDEYIDTNKYLANYAGLLEECEKAGLDEIDIDPIYMFVGVSTGKKKEGAEEDFDESLNTAGTYLLKKIDRAVFQREDGKISKAVWKNPAYAAGNPQTDKIMYGLEHAEYYSCKLIEELGFIKRTYTDRVTTLGSPVPNIAVYGNLKYDHIDGYAIILMPCGEDEANIFCYVLFAGNLLLNKDSGVENAYGVYMLTTVDGNPILQRMKKAGGVR